MTTDEQQIVAPFPIGYAPANEEEFDALPVGTRVDWNHIGQIWTKITPEGDWESENGSISDNDAMQPEHNYIVSYPEGYVAGPFPIGYAPQTAEEFDQLPTGTVLHHTNSGDEWTRNEDGRWVCDRDDYGISSEDLDLGGNTIVSYQPALPDEPPYPACRLNVGDRVHDQLDAMSLPPGAEVEKNGETYTKRRWNHWLPDGLSDRRIMNGTLTSLPDGFTPEPQPPLTLRLLKWRIYWAGTGQALASGQPLDQIESAFDAAGVKQRGLYVGCVLPAYYSTWLGRRIPEETVAMGGDPAVWTKFGVWKMHNRAWLKMFGGLAQPSDLGHRRELTVIQLPDGYEEDNWWRDPREDEGVRIQRFIAEAKEVGGEHKQRFTWCGSYEAAMTVAGLMMEET